MAVNNNLDFPVFPSYGKARHIRILALAGVLAVIFYADFEGSFQNSSFFVPSLSKEAFVSQRAVNFKHIEYSFIDSLW